MFCKRYFLACKKGDLGRLFVFLFLEIAHVHAEPLSITVQAESAILINADTGFILFEKDADVSHYPASTTKIATVLYALEHGNVPLDRLIPVEQEAIGQLSQPAKKRNQYRDAPYLLEPDGISLGLKKGEQVRLQDLLYASLLESANDAANVVAHYLGGSITEFMQELNLYLKNLGCKATQFVNPHGLHHPNHVSTARDLALLARHALKHPAFCEMMKTMRFAGGKIGAQQQRTFVQKNKLLKQGPYYYKKAIGLKTGYHAKAQHALVAAAVDQGRTLVAVLLKNADRGQMFLDAVRLFEKAFQEPLVMQTLFSTGKQPFALQLEGSRYPVRTELKAPVMLKYYPSEAVDVHAQVHWIATHLPVQKGEVVGELRLYHNDHILQTAPLLAVETVDTTLIYQLAHTLQKIPGLIWMVVMLVVSFCLYALFRRR